MSATYDGYQRVQEEPDPGKCPRCGRPTLTWDRAVKGMVCTYCRWRDRT